MTSTGAPRPVMRETVRKKQPMGTPALPTAATTEMSTHSSMVPMPRAMPPFCITKRELTRMKAAQPFMLMVVQMGRTKRETFGSTPRRFSADESVTGSVAAELFVKRAITTAGLIARKTFSGLIFRASRNSGRTTKNWMALPARMTAVYLPSEPRMRPALSWPASWAAKAAMPSGSVQMSALMSVKKSSCSPWIPLTTTPLPSVSGIQARARPMAMALSRMDRTFPDRKGWTTLFGMTEMMWS